MNESNKAMCDNVYYNVNIPHDDNLSVNGEPTPANYFEIRGTPLLPCRAEDYTVSVVRFSVPTSEIPIQIVPVDISQPDINKLLYSITLTWNGNEYQEYLTWVTANNYVEVPPNTLLAQKQRYAPYYYLYSIKHLTYRINLAFREAFDKLVLDGAPITAPPFMEYEETEGRLQIFVPDSYISAGVKVYANRPLNRNFGYGFDQIYNGYNTPNGKDAEFLVDRTGTNIITLEAPINPPPALAPFFYPSQDYVQLTQDYNSIVDMTSFTSIVLTTQNIPIRSEWVSLQELDGPLPVGEPVPSNPSTQDSFLNILSDFEVDIQTGFELRSKIVYNPSAEFRRITLQGGDLATIDLQAYWRDNYDNLYPLMIPAHDVLTVKLLFEKKK